jgi:segregation and condensation protein A
MSDILVSVRPDVFTDFTSLFRPDEGRMGVAVTFIAILELKREGLIEIVQNEPYAPIHISGVAREGGGRVIEGDAEEVVAADARLLADSIAAEGSDETGEEGGADEEAGTR